MMIVDASPTCFYHPITVVFLDDNRSFLDALELEFGSEMTMLTRTCPDTTYQIIDDHRQNISKLVFKSVDSSNADTITESIIGFDVGNIRQLIYDTTRFDKVAVLVVDYDMPDMNGIQFCQKVKEIKIGRMMLTAEADKDTAIKAFNQGLIDKFLLKTSAALYSEITLALQELIQRYFKELSLNIINGQDGSISDLFSNEAYGRLFKRVALQAQAVEYYLVDNSGSFLFLDKDANPTWLIIRHNQAIDEQLELLEGYDVPEQWVSSIAKKEKILFLLSEKEYKKSVDEWTSYLFDSTTLDDNYCYSIVRGQLTDSIDWNQVVSYATYRSQKNSVA